MSTDKPTKAHALVTGASSGIGAAFAERLAQDGYDLIIVARRRDKLEVLASQLRSDHQVRVEVLAADLSKPDVMRSVEKKIAEDSALELLINNAGFGGYMAFAELDPDKAEELINLQVLAVTRLTRAALPGMIARKHGSIINVSSRLAFSGSLGVAQLPKRATYAGTKAFISIHFRNYFKANLKGQVSRYRLFAPGSWKLNFTAMSVQIQAAFLPASS